jgi:hypothetical protein
MPIATPSGRRLAQVEACRHLHRRLDPGVSTSGKRRRRDANRAAHNRQEVAAALDPELDEARKFACRGGIDRQAAG